MLNVCVQQNLRGLLVDLNLTSTENKPLILVGAGGHARSTLDVIFESNQYSVSGFLDDSIPRGTCVLGSPVLGPVSLLAEFVGSHRFVIAIGKIGGSLTRRQIAEQCWSAGGSLETVISPMAYVSPRAHVGEGSTVFHGAVVNSGAVVGSNCIINSQALIEHDVSVGNHTHVSTGVLINGECQLGQDVFVGSGAVLHHKVELADGTVVSAGQVISRSLRQ